MEKIVSLGISIPSEVANIENNIMWELYYRRKEQRDVTEKTNLYSRSIAFRSCQQNQNDDGRNFY